MKFVAPLLAFACLLVAMPQLSLAAAPGTVDLIANGDGSLALDGGNVDLNGFSIKSAGGQLIADADGNASPFQFYLQNDELEVAAGSIGAVNVNGLLNLDAAVSPGDLANLDLTFQYGTALGTFDGNIVVIPEPASLVLITMGGLLALRRRRAA